jgi:hypothetical protein
MILSILCEMGYEHKGHSDGHFNFYLIKHQHAQLLHSCFTDTVFASMQRFTCFID